MDKTWGNGGQTGRFLLLLIALPFERCPSPITIFCPTSYFSILFYFAKLSPWLASALDIRRGPVLGLRWCLPEMSEEPQLKLFHPLLI